MSASPTVTRRRRVCVIADSTHSGGYGHNLHTPWRGIPGAEVVALSDPDADAHEFRAAECGAQRTYTDHCVMLANESPDFVSVCPHYYQRHAEWLLDCIAAGVQGIYVEKPMTRTLAEADAVLDAADQAGVRITVAHQWGNFNTKIQAACQWIREGGIGAIRRIDAHGKIDRRGGSHDLFIHGTHLADLMVTLAGPALWVDGRMTIGGSDVGRDDIVDGPEGSGPLAGDAAFGTFAFADGVMGTLESFVHAQGVPGSLGVDVWGARGAVSIRRGGEEVTVYPAPLIRPGDDSQRWEQFQSESGSPSDTVPESQNIIDEPNRRAVTDLIAACDGAREPKSGARAATAALEMVMGVLESHRLGTRVSFPMILRENPFAVWRAESGSWSSMRVKTPARQ